MKNRQTGNLIRGIAILALVLLPGSCLEYTVSTTVNRDGSIIREYTARGDSSEIFKGSLIIPSGNQWKISQGFEKDDRNKKASERQYVYTASRKFSNVSELNDWVASDTSLGKIRIRINLKKRFRWFYNYYDYTEMYPMTFPFKNVSVDSFLTLTEQSFLMEDGRAVYSPYEKKWILKQDTLKYIYNHADSLEMKRMDDRSNKKLEIWMTTAIVNEFSDIVKRSFSGEPSFAGIGKKLSGNIENIRNKTFKSKDSVMVKSLILMVDSLAQNNRLSELYKENPLVFKEFESKLKKVDNQDYSDVYEYNLGMPGQVYSTNAFRRDSVGLKWKFGSMEYFMKDFEMKAQSRAANPWIMVLTGIVAVMLIYIVTRRRTKA